MILTEQEKKQIEETKNTTGWAIIKKLEEEASMRLFSSIASVDLDNKENINYIKTQQIYSKARKDFFENIEAHLTRAYEPELNQIREESEF